MNKRIDVHPAPDLQYVNSNTSEKVFSEHSIFIVIFEALRCRFI